VQHGTERLAPLIPEAIRTRTFDTLKQMSLQGSQQRPLIFEIEDLHWIDHTSQDFLVSLVESVAGAVILLLTTYRPGYHPPWIDKFYATQLSLRSLTPQDSATVVHSTSHHAVLPASVEHRVIEQAEGNPFFLEELTRAVMEQGARQAAVFVPDTIHGVLSARLDRLPEAHKRLLQTASVLGREFSLRLLEAMWDGTSALEPLLLELKRLEFLFERTGAGDSTYVFKHALTQEVAYASLLTPRQQALHAAAGQALEALYADWLEEVQDRLAYHYAYTDNAAKAVEYLRLVAEKATRSYAHAEAVASFEVALAHAERLSEDACDRVMITLAIRHAESLFWWGIARRSLTFSSGTRSVLIACKNLRWSGGTISGSVLPMPFWESGSKRDRVSNALLKKARKVRMPCAWGRHISSWHRKCTSRALCTKGSSTDNKRSRCLKKQTSRSGSAWVCIPWGFSITLLGHAIVRWRWHTGARAWCNDGRPSSPDRGVTDDRMELYATRWMGSRN
jgi:hypothetical protein